MVTLDPNNVEFSAEDAVREAARKHGVNEDLAVAVAQQESGMNQGSRSPKGAVGVMQLMPSTAAQLRVDPADPQQNIEGGVRHLKQLMDKYNGDATKALAAYNAGAGRVDSGDPLPLETRAYVPAVIGRANKATAGVSDWEDVAPAKKSVTFDPSEVSLEQSSVPAKESALDRVKKWGKAAVDVGTTNALKGLDLPTLSEGYDKLFPPVEEKSALSQASEASRRIARTVPELADFALTPLGAATAATGGAPAAVRAGVGAGFSTDIATQQVPEAYKTFRENPTAGNAVDLLKAAAFVALPFAHSGNAKLRQKLTKGEEASETPISPTPAEAAAEAIKIPPKPKFGNSLDGRAAKAKFDATERANAIKAKAKAQQDAARAKEKAAADALKQKAKEQKEAERAQKEAAKAQIEQAKQAQEAKAAELKAKIQGMPPAEVEKGISEAVKALPDDQLREVAAAQEVPKPPKEGAPEEPLSPMARDASVELLRRKTESFQPFRILQGTYEPLPSLPGDIPGNARFRFTNVKGGVHEDQMPLVDLQRLASKGFR